jgi:predicted DNA-binding protein with PD1-like motif
VKPGQSVPHVVTLSAGFQRIVIARFKYQTDLLEGLQEAVRTQKVQNAVILGGIGSVTSYHLHTVSNTTLPPENVFYKAQGPYDVTAVNGYVINGRVHCHITLTNEQQAIAGHLEPGTRAFTFVAITLGVFGDEVDLERLDDNTWR